MTKAETSLPIEPGKRRLALIISVMGIGAFAVTLLVYTVFAITANVPSLYLSALIQAPNLIAWLYAFRTVQQGKGLRGYELALITLIVTAPLNMLVLQGLGWMSALATIIAVAIAAGLVLPNSRVVRYVLLTLVSSALTFFLDFYGSPERLSLEFPATFATATIVVIVTLLLILIATQFRNFSLRTKLITVFVGLALVSTLGITIVSSQAIRDSLTTNAARDLRTRAQSAALAIGITMERNVDRLQTMSLDKRLQDDVTAISDAYPTDGTARREVITKNAAMWASADPQNPVIQNALNGELSYGLRQFGEVFLGNKELFITDMYGATIAATSWQPNYNFRDFGWWQIAYSGGNGDVYIGQPEFNPMINEYGVRIAMPIYAPGRRRAVGVLHAIYTLPALQRALLLNSFGQSGKIDLLFPQGQVLTSDGTFRALTSEEFSEVKQGINFPLATLNYRGTPLLSSQGVVGVSDEQPEPYLRSSAWRTIATIEQDEALGAAEAATQAALLAGVVTIGIAVLLALLLAQILTRPIRRLTGVAEQVQGGDLSARARIETGDEIGTLARTFNAMTGRLQDTLAGLERRVAERTHELSEVNLSLQANSAYLSALSDTSTGLFERLNLNDLLQAIVERAGALMGTQDGFVFFAEPGDKEIQMRVGSGLYDDLVGTRAQSGVGLAGTVWQTGAPRVIEDYQTWEGRLPGSRRDALHAIAAVPLKRGAGTGTAGETVGVIGLAYTDPSRRFGKQEVEILQRFAQLASIALDNAELYANSENRVQELGALNTISTLVVQSSDLYTVVERVGDEIRRIFDADFGYFALVNTDKNVIEFPYTVDDGKRIFLDPVPMGQGITSQVITSGEAMMLSNATSDDYERLGAVDSGDGSSPHSLLVVPVQSGDNIIGALSVQRVAQYRAFSGDDLQLLTTIAASVGIGIENARLALGTQRRVAELTAVNRVSAILNTPGDLTERLKQAGREFVDIFGVSSVYIALFEAERNIVHMPFFVEDGKETEIPSGPRGTGFVAHVLSTNQPLLVNARLLERFQELGGVWIGDNTVLPKSYLAVPISAGNEAVGVLALNALPENHFTDADVRFLSTLAGVISAAIQNQRLGQATERRLAELAALNTISSILTSDQPLTLRLSQVGVELHAIFKVVSAYVALYDPLHNRIQMPFFMGGNEVFAVDPFELGPGFTSHIIKTRAPLVINDEMERRMQELNARNVGDPDTAQSYLGVPIIIGDEVYGVVGLSDALQNKFQDSDVRLLSTIAAALGSAIQNARLIEQMQERARELDAVNSLAREITQQRALDDLFKEVYLQVKSVTPADGLIVSLYDERTDTLSVPFLMDEGQQYEMPPGAMQFERDYAEQVRTGEVLMINSTPEQVAELEKSNAVAGGGRVSRSRIYLPLMAGVRFLGMISLHSYEFNAYGERDVAVLSGLASHIAVALENARLFEQTRHALAETQRLASRERQAAMEVMALNRRLSREGWREYVERDPSEYMAVAGDEDYTPATNGHSASGNGSSNGNAGLSTSDKPQTVLVPIYLRGEEIGAIELEYDDLEKGWSAEHQELVNSVVENLSLALDNARLHEQTQRALAETQRSAEREKTAAAIADRIYAATDVKAILKIATQELRRTTGSTRAVVRLTRDKPAS